MAENTALINYLSTRRSAGLAFLREPGPTPGQLQTLLEMATRVPDHGKLAPWRLIVIAGEARAAAGEKLAVIAKRNNPALDEASLDVERSRFLPAPLTIGVVFSPRQSSKAPELEQMLSAGCVCFNLLHAAAALGFGASWVTRWFSYDLGAQQMLGARGGERFAGFIHIGTAASKAEERERPALDDVVSYWAG